MNKLYAVYIYSFKFWVEKNTRNDTKMIINLIVEVFFFFHISQNICNMFMLLFN